MNRFSSLMGLALIAGGTMLAASGVQTPPPQKPPQTPPAAPAPPDAQTQPIFRATSDVVAVDVSVLDGEGRPVRGLQPDDFTVEVDGTPRRIVSSEFVSQTASPSADQPEEYSTNEEILGGRLIMLVIDAGNISQGDGRPYCPTFSLVAPRDGVPAARGVRGGVRLRAHRRSVLAGLHLLVATGCPGARGFAPRRPGG